MTYGYIMTNSQYISKGQILTVGRKEKSVGTKERKEREKAARRDAILEAAKSVFFERGYHTATMDQIAEKVELSKGSLYLHFPSKEELYISLLVEGLAELCKRFDQAVQTSRGWEEKLLRIADAYYGFYQENPNYFKILFFFQHGEIASKVSDELYQECFNKGTQCLDFISQAIQEGMDAGAIKQQDPATQAVVLWGAFNGVLFLYEDEDHRKMFPLPLDQIVHTSLEMFLNGLKKR